MLSLLVCSMLMQEAKAILSNCPAWQPAKMSEAICLLTKSVLIFILFPSLGGKCFIASGE